MTCNNLLSQCENTSDKEVEKANTQLTVVSTLTSRIPARLLPGNGMSDYLWRGKNGGLTLPVHLEKINCLIEDGVNTPAEIRIA